MIQVDAGDEWRLGKFHWAIQKTTPAYAFRIETVGGRSTKIFLHREILNAKQDEFVDHKNGDGLNCKKGNIRICSHSENMQNRKVAKNNKLGVKGVWMRRGKYIAEIKAFGVHYRLGSFASLDAATIAYNDAAKRLHGDFARINHQHEQEPQWPIPQ